MPASKELSASVVTVNEEETEGIRIDFTVPKGANHFVLLIDGVGMGPVYEKAPWESDISEDKTVFFPYVKKGKSYDVLIIFNEAPENSAMKVVGWKRLKAIPKGGEGELTIVRKPNIAIDKKGNLTVSNIKYSVPGWVVSVALWKAENYVDWLGGFDIPDTEIGEPYNLYDYIQKGAKIGWVSFDAFIKYIDSESVEWKYRLPGIDYSTINQTVKLSAKK